MLWNTELKLAYLELPWIFLILFTKLLYLQFCCQIRIKYRLQKKTSEFLSPTDPQIWKSMYDKEGGFNGLCPS